MLTGREQRAADLNRAVPHQRYVLRRSTTMNVITNLLAGLVHFVGWLV